MIARPKGPLTPRESELGARLLAVLLPLTPQERLHTPAIVCRALWDGRLHALAFDAPHDPEE